MHFCCICLLLCSLVQLVQTCLVIWKTLVLLFRWALFWLWASPLLSTSFSVSYVLVYLCAWLCLQCHMPVCTLKCPLSRRLSLPGTLRTHDVMYYCTLGLSTVIMRRITYMVNGVLSNRYFRVTDTLRSQDVQIRVDWVRSDWVFRQLLSYAL